MYTYIHIYIYIYIYIYINVQYINVQYIVIYYQNIIKITNDKDFSALKNRIFPIFYTCKTLTYQAL